MVEIQLGRELILPVRDRLETVLGQGIGRDLAEAQLTGTWIHRAHHAAAIAGIGHEQDLRALELELPDKMLELLAQDALLRSRRGRLEPRQEEYIFHAVGRRAAGLSGLQSTVSGNRQDDQVVL